MAKRFGARCAMAALSLAMLTASAEDWPQWRGANSDGVSQETGIVDAWPEGGPKELWRVPLGNGFSGIAVVGDRAYTMCGTKNDEFVVCLNVADGSEVWRVRSDKGFTNSFGDGPRATPTVDGDRLYTHGASGSLLCLDTRTGKRIWGFNTLTRFKLKNTTWGLSASPVVYGRMLLVVAGSGDGSSVVALNKADGEVIWKGLDGNAGYTTPTIEEIDGKDQIIAFMGTFAAGLSPADGSQLWRFDWPTRYEVNAANPIYSDGQLFISSGYNKGAASLKLTKKGDKYDVESVWESRDMQNHFSSCVLIDGYLYGFNLKKLTCMDFKTGEVKWEHKGFDTGSLLAADGKFIIYGEKKSQLALAKISPDAYTELSQTKVLSGKTWTIPTLANGRLFVRNEKEIVCLDVKK